MTRKYIARYIITAVLVIVWLRTAFVNRAIVIEPIRKFPEKEYSFQQVRDDIAKKYPADLKEKYDFIDLNGLFVRLSGGRKCNEIIKLKNGSLTSVSIPGDTAENARKTIELRNQLEKMGIDFLYVQAPFKTNAELLPYGLEDATDDNVDAFLSEIDGKVPYIDLRPYITDSGEHINEYFYKTDHHWNPVGAFKGFQVISDYLQSAYPDEKIVGDRQNLDNWQINKKENWFLGSRGKRTGTYFGGVDDLIWLTPKFDTEMSCANVYKDEFYYGDYYEANIREEYIQERDYFLKNAYCVYIGGNYPLVQHRNLLAPVDKKLLIIKDSFVLPLQSYFSTVFHEVDVIDMREFTAGTLYEYIDESHPDIVMMCFNGNGVVSDDLYGSGVNEYDADGDECIVFRKETFSIEAETDEAYEHATVYEGVKAGKRYTLMCDSVDVVKGNPEGISAKLYDEETDTFADCAMWDNGYCEETDTYAWTFTAPSDANNLKVLIYSGIAGHTNGNAITLNNVRLVQK
ncbi:MAG: hypothetical protein K6G07_08120 [Lachnospiraceae bacterium]|nr:hypothetical protein [Lachnospiraceae bacterium]